MLVALAHESDATASLIPHAGSFDDAVELDKDTRRGKTKSNPEANKQHAIEFYKMAFAGNPKEAVRLYVGNEYIQHNPLVANGPEAFIEYFDRMHKEYPEKRKQGFSVAGRWRTFVVSRCAPCDAGPGRITVYKSVGRHCNALCAVANASAAIQRRNSGHGCNVGVLHAHR